MFYEKLGLKKNPCTILPTEDIIGLDKEIETVKDYAKSENICFLHGDTGTGKTSLLIAVEKVLRKEGIKIISIDSKTLSGIKNLDFLQRFYPAYTQYKSRKDSRNIIDKIKSKFIKLPKTVLLLDEFQRLPEYLVDQVEGNFNERIFHSVIIAQQKEALINCSASFLQRVGERKIQTRKLNENECFELIKKRFDDKAIFKKEILRTIIIESKRIPRVILENIERILMHLDNENILASKINKEGGLNINEDDIKQLCSKGVIRFELPQEKERDGVNDISLPGLKKKTVKEKVLNSLARSSKTIGEIAEDVQSTSGAVRKILSDLMKRDYVVETKKKKPKIYGVNPEIKRSIAED